MATMAQQEILVLILLDLICLPTINVGMLIFHM